VTAFPMCPNRIMPGCITVSILADVMRHRKLRRCAGCSFPCDGFVVIATRSAPNQRLHLGSRNGRATDYAACPSAGW
jgi:hypothetical protein